MSRPSGSVAAMPSEVTALLRKLGSDLKKARKARGFSIREMALRARVTPGTYMKLERGEAVSTALLLTAAWVLGMSRAFFDVLVTEHSFAEKPVTSLTSRLLEDIEHQAKAKAAS